MATKDEKYNMLREKLSINGYDQLLSFESMVLVESLINDLLHYKNNFSTYKILADELMQQCNVLKINQEPLKQEYDNLCQENNFLSLQIIQGQDRFQENVNELKNQISELKNAYSDLELLNVQHITRIGELEEEVLLQNKKLFKFEGFAKYVKGTNQSSESMKKKGDKCVSSEGDVNSMKKINNSISYSCSPNLQDELNKEFNTLKLEKKKLSNMIELYKHKISSRDIEIKRLHEKIKKSVLPITNNFVCKCHFLEENIVVSVDGDKEKAFEESALFVEIEELKKNNLTLKTKVISLEKQLSQYFEEMSKLQLDCIEVKKRHGLLQMNVTSPHNESDNFTSGGKKEAVLDIKNAEKQTIVDANPQKHYNCLCMKKKNSKDFREVFIQTNVLDQLLNFWVCTFITACIYLPFQTNLFVLDISDDKKMKSFQLILEKVKAERDYFCREYHCLQDKLCKSPVNRTDQENSLLITKVDETQQCDKNVLKINLLLKANINALIGRNHQLEEENKCLKKINENFQEQLKYDDVLKSKQGYELSCTENKIKVLELDRNDLLTKLSSIQHNLKESESTIFLLEREKDQYRCKLDSKTVMICELEKESQQKSLLINAHENKIVNFEAELARAYEVTDTYKKLTDRLKDEVEACLTANDTLTTDNKNLLMDLAKITQENDVLKSKINCSENEVASLKQRLQVYVEEVRRVEEVLESKENERENLLEQFKALSVEAMQLESSNQTLENEKKIATDSLRIVNERLINSSADELHNKATEMKSELENLRQQVSKFKSDNLVLQTSMEYFKTIYELKNRELSDSNKVKKQLLDEMQQIEQNCEGFETNINLAQNIVELLKRNQEKYNYELVKSFTENTATIRFLDSYKKCINEIEHRLCDMNETIQKCNKIFSSFKNENLSLHHDGVNDMFERISGDDETNSFSTSL